MAQGEMRRNGGKMQRKGGKRSKMGTKCPRMRVKCRGVGGNAVKWGQSAAGRWEMPWDRGSATG